MVFMANRTEISAGLWWGLLLYIPTAWVANNIGRAVATRQATDGFAVIVKLGNGNSTKPTEVVAEIKASGGKAIAFQADVANAFTCWYRTNFHIATNMVNIVISKC